MKGFKALIITLVVVVILVVVLSPYFIVEMGEQAVVVRFKEIVRTETPAASVSDRTARVISGWRSSV